jgi:hypothetical protein
MTRLCTIAAIIALTTSGAHAFTSEQVPAQIHDAAVAACAPEGEPGLLPRSHYGAIEDECVYRLSRDAMIQYEAVAAAGPVYIQVASNKP